MTDYPQRYETTSISVPFRIMPSGLRPMYKGVRHLAWLGGLEGSLVGCLMGPIHVLYKTNSPSPACGVSSLISHGQRGSNPIALGRLVLHPDMNVMFQVTARSPKAVRYAEINITRACPIPLPQVHANQVHANGDHLQ